MNKSFLKKEKESILLFLFLLSVYIFFQSQSIYGGDAGDLAAAAATGSFAHPPGYPLYSFLARLLLFFPFYTPAWRIALLSSIPSALSLTLLFLILKSYFNKLAALAAVLFTAFIYPIFLYSAVVEVFSLNNFFILLLFYLMLRWRQSKKERYFYFFSIFLGLALSHHQIILFSIPAFYFIGWPLVKRIKKSILLKSLLLFLAGLLPYLYMPLSSLTNKTVFYWGNGLSLKGFWWIIARQGYGTFKALGGIGEQPIHRLLSIYTFFRYLFLEYNFLAVLFFLLGGFSFFYILRKKKSKSSLTILLTASFIMFISYLFFIFYASFPLISDFLMATVERFYIIPFIFLSPFIALGLDTAFRLLKNLKNPQIKKSSQILLKIIILLLPVIIFSRNFYKIYILKNDFTAENLGYDILTDLPENSIFVPSYDTVIFNTEYVHYNLGFSPDTLILESAFLGELPYREKIKQNYPQIEIDNLQGEFGNFVAKNIKNHAIYSNASQDIDNLVQIPEGLMLRFYDKEATPSTEEVWQKNKYLVSNFQDFNKSSLNKYENLFLLNVKSVYIGAYRRLLEYFLDLEEYDKAEYFAKIHSQLADKDNAGLLLYWGQIYLGQNKCQLAEEHFLQVKEKLPDSPLPDAFLRQVYLNCFKDENRAGEYLESCFEKEEKGETSLQDL